MPIRYVIVPTPIDIVHPFTGQTLGAAPMTFAGFVRERLFCNPLWSASRRAIRASDAIDRALGSANRVLGLAEEDWQLLLRAVEEPIFQPFETSAILQKGFGLHPSATRQILPFVEAIANATTEPPEGR
jgi:hypothetical protein